MLVARAAGTGANAARILVGHDDVGAPGPTAAIEAIEDAGMQAIVCLWTVTDFTDHSPSDPDGYYAGRVTAALAAWPNVLIECFNEPNLTAAFIPGYEFTLATAARCVTSAVQAAGPGKVIGPAIATLPDETTYLQYQDDLYYYIYAMGGLTDLYGIATHIYPSAPYPAATPLTDGLFQYARHIERTAAWGKPVYVTETGFQAGIYGASQDAYTVWGWSNYISDPRVAGYFVYRLYPDPGDIQQMSISDNVSLRDALTDAWLGFVQLDSVAAHSSATLALKTSTRVALNPSASTSTATLLLGVAGRVVLSTSATTSTTSLSLTTTTVAAGPLPDAVLYPGETTYPGYVVPAPEFDGPLPDTDLYPSETVYPGVEAGDQEPEPEPPLDDPLPDTDLYPSGLLYPGAPGPENLTYADFTGPTGGVIADSGSRGGVVYEIRTGGTFDQVRTGGVVNEVATGDSPDRSTSGIHDDVLTGGGVL